MKLLKISSVLALTATSLLGGATAFASTEDGIRNATTPADITFIAGDTDGGGTEVVVPRPDPENPIVIIPILPDDNKGPLTIAYAPTLNFGTQEISTADRHYSAKAEMHELVDENELGTGEFIPWMSFVQVQDTRGTNEGWQLNVSLSPFTTTDETALNQTLQGVHIKFLGSELNYVPGVIEQEPTLKIPGDSFILSPGTGSQDLMIANEGEGAGTTDILWGNQTELNEQFAAGAEVLNNNIQLYVPGSTLADAVAYTADLEWTLEAGPFDGESN